MTASRRLWWSLFALALAANLVLLFWPRPVGAGGVPHLDKVAHAASFAAVAWSGARAGVPRRALAVVLAVHAVTSELAQQTLLPDRSGDPADVLADLVGVWLGLGAASWLHERVAERRGSDRAAAGRQPDAR